jgi:hypothetical protein
MKRTAAVPGAMISALVRVEEAEAVVAAVGPCRQQHPFPIPYQDGAFDARRL